MNSRSAHISDNDLLLLTDCELASSKAAALRKHLAVCHECQERLARLKNSLDGIAAVYSEERPRVWDASGPRAHLKARLHEEAKQNTTILPRSLRAIPATRTLVFACALLLLTAFFVRFASHSQWRGQSVEIEPLPNPAFTPGLTRQANLADLCATSREEVVRSVPLQIEQKVFQEYGIRNPGTSEFEVDYLIAPGLGGADDLKNLWPEPHSNTVWNSYAKDQLEDRLHRMVCERKVPLDQAQRDIAENWISAYKKYFKTDLPTTNVSLNHPGEAAHFGF